MKNLEKSLLCPQSKIQVYRPSLDFFTEKIKSNVFFSFTRQMHGLWDAVISAWILDDSLRNVKLSDNDYKLKLACTMSKAKKQTDGLYYESSFYYELLNILESLDKSDKDFFFGISDTHFYPEVPPPYLPEHFVFPHKCNFKYLKTKDRLKYFKLRFSDRQKIIQLLLPKNKTFFDASIWKLYAYMNQIWKLFDTIKNHPIIFVGPTHYKNFDNIAKFTNYHHIPIHGSKASVQRKEILEKVTKKYITFSDSELTPIIFFVAGSVSVYLVYHLHHSLKKKFLLDIGQAFNFLYHKKSSLLHREFGYSHNASKGRKIYNTDKLYGARDFKSNMDIQNNIVSFDLDLKFKDIWLEKLMLFFNERGIRRNFFKMKYNFYNFFSR